MTFKLLQLNTWHGAKVFKPTIDFLRQENADILHLQEVYNNEQGYDFPNHPNYSLLQYIQENFDYPYVSFSKTFDVQVTPGHNIPLGNATFSRFPILDFHTEYMPNNLGFDYGVYESLEPQNFSQSPANFLASTINFQGTQVKSINMHGVWGFDGLDNERRIQMRDQVLHEIEDDEFVICSGDFNTLPETETMNGIGDRLHNIFDGELRSTFNPKRWKHNDLEFVVDYLFVSHNIEVISHDAPRVDISDHMPLLATLELL